MLSDLATFCCALRYGTYSRAVLLRSRRTGDLVVSKEVPVGHLGGGEQLKAVRNEVRILASLAHPNIVAYFSSFVQQEDAMLASAPRRPRRAPLPPPGSPSRARGQS